MIEIPQKIKDVFKNLPEGKIVPLGVSKGIHWYMYDFKELLETGFPLVYGIGKNNSLEHADGHDALRIVDLFIKD